MKKLYLIGGPMGVGKTAVGQELKRKLSRSVFLDGDWCWDANPFQVTAETQKMVLENICFLLNQFIRCSAYEHIIFCWVMHEQSIIDGILRNLETTNCEIKAISLLCAADELRERLSRGIAAGRREPDVLERSLARMPLYDQLNTIKINTSGKTVGEIAEELARL
ncbi:MAG TPA: AAA family ATPase [Limnochordia bacterium]|jgi:broad-specificity NMP kinase|nr:AAA family ATPase [Limnochordia bacterium]HOK32437.1 AAA family ATPase [Limnochordia bacterium]HOQ73524.1 AAA family ATPase [Limnochordia bacterium]HPU64822.1 AAA family ATPase [Limnochordia bacterium]